MRPASGTDAARRREGQLHLSVNASLCQGGGGRGRGSSGPARSHGAAAPSSESSSPPTTACLNSHCRLQKGHFCSAWLDSHLHRCTEIRQQGFGTVGEESGCGVGTSAARGWTATCTEVRACVELSPIGVKPPPMLRWMAHTLRHVQRHASPAATSPAAPSRCPPPIDALQVEGMRADAPHHGRVVPGELAVRRAAVKGHATDAAHVVACARAGDGGRAWCVGRHMMVAGARGQRRWQTGAAAAFNPVLCTPSPTGGAHTCVPRPAGHRVPLLDLDVKRHRCKACWLPPPPPLPLAAMG